METLKLRILNRFGSLQKLSSPDEISVHFPYESTDSLCKRMTQGHVKILNADKGEIEVDVSPFEVQGMPLGENQNFVAIITQGSKTLEAHFTRALHVRTMDIGGEQRKVIQK